MKTAYEVFLRFRSKEIAVPIREALEKIEVLELPEDLLSFGNVDKRKSIVIMKKSSIYNSLQILHRGFSHCLQAEREDFHKELLVSCLMLIRPDSLANNEVPFFFGGISKEKKWKGSDSAIFASGRSSEDRQVILNRLVQFLSEKKQLTAIADLAVQIFDELYSNALYRAPPQVSSGIQANKATTNVTSTERPIEFFAACDKEQLFIGCIDNYGSLERKKLTGHLLKIYSADAVDPDLGAHGGAGIGLKMVIDNSANFYVYVEKNRRTVIGCAILLQGRKANLTQNKHLHINFVD